MKFLKKIPKPPANSGYSLIELTVVVGLISILTIAITAIMMSNLLSTTRIRSLVKVRQNGDYATTQIQQLIRNARSIETCSSGGSSDYITFINEDGGQTTIQEDNNRIASISAQSTFYLTNDTIQLSNFDLVCEPYDSLPILIRLSFALSNISSSDRPYENVSVSFDTSVELRNQ